MSEKELNLSSETQGQGYGKHNLETEGKYHVEVY